MRIIGRVDRLRGSTMAAARSAEQREGRSLGERRGRHRQLCLPGRALCTALTILLASVGGTAAADPDSSTIGLRVPTLVRELRAGLPEFFKICQDQQYALCAVASCYVFNQVAYCKCDVEDGDSISLPFEVDGEDVCDVNANGPANGYIVSTFSVPNSVLEDGDMALYTCRGGTSDGAYAQCDGGLCFTSTNGAPSFPGFDEPLAEGEIICSCPITTANPDQPDVGYQIAGPFPCEDSYFENCQSATTNSRTGSHIPVGAPTGTATILSLLLDGPPLPALNKCEPPRTVVGP